MIIIIIIFIIINLLIKITNYMLIKVIIDIAKFLKAIFGLIIIGKFLY